MEFEIFEGTKICVLVECKKHRRPVERNVILGVHAKAQAVGAQKFIVFPTSGFQKGGIEFAKSAGVALVIFVDGELTYVTRSREPLFEAGYLLDLPDFAEQMIWSEGDRTSISTVTSDRINQ